MPDVHTAVIRHSYDKNCIETLLQSGLRAVQMPNNRSSLTMFRLISSQYFSFWFLNAYQVAIKSICVFMYMVLYDF